MALKTDTLTPKKTAQRRRKSSPKKGAKNRLWLKIGLGVALVLSVVGGVKYLLDATVHYNPLLGKWRTHTVMGVMEIEFERDSMSSFGSKTGVLYTIEDKRVIVIDDTIKVGVSYAIIDENTIAKEVGKSKIIYKRVK